MDELPWRKHQRGFLSGWSPLLRGRNGSDTVGRIVEASGSEYVNKSSNYEICGVVEVVCTYDTVFGMNRKCRVM